MKNTRILKYLLITLIIFFTFFSCDKDSIIGTLNTEELFSINYGSYEDEFNIYTSNPDDYFSEIAMINGFFYISDSASQKVSQFSSYGDLVSIIYNPENNPVPSFVELSDIEVADVGFPTEAATKRSTEYPFHKTTSIALDTRQYLYVADYLPEERYETDSESGQLLRQIVLRFSNDGTFIDYIGQQGPGGVPFPAIKDIYTTNNNELIVVTVSNEKNTVFWFSEDGFLKYTIPFYYEQLPGINTEGTGEVFASLDDIIPDYNDQKLYIKIDYSTMTYDSSSQVQSGINYEKTYLYTFNLLTEQYEDSLVIPSYEEVISSEYSKTVYEIPYDFLGVTESGWFFFILTEDSGYSVMMIAPNGNKIIKRNLEIQDKNLLYYNLSLSSNGIIVGFLSTNEKNSVVWWRTDSIIENLLVN